MITATFNNVDTCQLIEVKNINWEQLGTLARTIWTMFYDENKHPFPYSSSDFDGKLHFGDDFLCTEDVK